MKFHRPVKGDEVSLFAMLMAVGRSSMQIHVEAWRRSRDSDLTEKVTEATFTFVALDEGVRPRPVPPTSRGLMRRDDEGSGQG